MKLVISDLMPEQLRQVIHVNDDTVIISNDNRIKHCIGCFGCWIKTPGTCVIKDPYQHLGELFSKCTDMIIISKCVYGGYSPFVKNVLDRGLSYLHPDFEIRHNEMHHKMRYKNKFDLSICFYGDSISDAEMITAKEMAKANFVNYAPKKHNLYLVNSLEEIGGLFL
ncbi:MAG TPA: flavoprotein [Firmicutes bacterium]|nr:flavoprotein [Bacillota bacterium]